MDAKQFLAEFGHIAQAPGGVQQLRDMVYQLAITGDLTASGINYSCGRELLENVLHEKKRRIKAKKFKRTPKLEKISSHSRYELSIPDHWIWTDLVSIGEINPKNEAKDEVESSFIPMSAISEFHSEKLAPETRKWKTIKKGYTHVANGDVVIAKITPCFENRKSAVISDLKNRIGAGTTELHVVRPLPGILADYIYIFLRSPYFMVKGEQNMTGTAGQKRLPTIYFATRPIPLPPTEEQTRIVAKVDELMALCDRLEQQQQRKRTLQNQLRQATLQAVATATSPFELKQHWQRLEANFQYLFTQPEDVEELRTMVLDLTTKGTLCSESTKEDYNALDDFLVKLAKNKTGKRIARISEFKQPFKLPDGWRWVLMEDLLFSSESGWSPKCDSETRQGDSWGVLKVSAVTWGTFKPEENKRLPLSLEPREDAEVKEGDFLLSRANTAELVARSVILDNTTPKHLMMSDKIVRLNFINNELKPWVNLVNNSEFSRAYYYKNATGTSESMRNISRQIMHELPIPLPSLKQQKLAIKKHDALQQVCESLAKKLKSANQFSKSLAITSVATLIGIQITKKEEPLKAPQNELHAPVKLGQNKPNKKANAPLATLVSRASGEIQAKDLWQRFGGEIDAFYNQLKIEIAHGWIAEPDAATMLEKDAERNEA